MVVNTEENQRRMATSYCLMKHVLSPVVLPWCNRENDQIGQLSLVRSFNHGRAAEQNPKRRAFAYSRFIILEVRQLRKHSDNHLDDRRERAGGRRDFILRRCSVSNRDTFNHSKSNQTLFPINLKQHK